MESRITLTKQEDGSYALVQNETAEMEAMATGIVNKIPKLSYMNVPIGDALKGMVAAGVGDAAGVMAIRFLPSQLTGGQYSVPILKVLTILALNWKPVKKFVGPGSVEVASIILAYEAIASVFNVRMKTFNLLSGVLGKLPGSTTTTGTSTVVAGIQTI